MTRLVYGFLFLISLLLACSCSDPVQSAISELEQRTPYSFTEDGFVSAAANGDDAALMLFGRAQMDPDAASSGGRTALIAASEGGYLETVKLLLGAGADPRLTDIDGRDALISCTTGGHLEVARVLLSRGSDPAHRDLDGWSALAVASYEGHAEMVDLLGSHAPLEQLNEALLLAASAGNGTSVTLLLNQGASPGARSPSDLTPLMIASQNGHQEVVAILLNRKADPDATAGEGIDAARIAKSAGHAFIHEMLTETPPPTSEPEPGPQQAKPLAALNGSTIRSLSDVDRPLSRFEIEDFQMQPLPVALVGLDGKQATIRRINPSGEAHELQIPEGRMIPGTPFRVENVEELGADQLAAEVTHPRIRIENIETGERHLLTGGNDARPTDTFAILSAPNSQHRFVAKPGDRFTTVSKVEGTREYEVFEIRSSQIDLKNLEDHTLVTVGQ